MIDLKGKKALGTGETLKIEGKKTFPEAENIVVMIERAVITILALVW